MLTNRTKAYGVPDDINYMFGFEQDKKTITNALYNMMLATKNDIDSNHKVLKNRGSLMHTATWFTLSAIIFIFISFALIQSNL
ncbi:MAG: hypothetical protein Q9M36_05600 [Sulfurovum sp.]|nr:hypothetical protein [Sulfurovum sp.]